MNKKKIKKKDLKNKKTDLSACNLSIGGQAVMEGVMMRSKYNLAIAIRRPDNKISVKKKIINSWQKKLNILNWPFIRGVYSLFETLIIGIGALTYSANESIGEEEEKLSSKEITITLIIAMLFGIGLFIVLPFFLSKMITTHNIWFNLIDGIIRVLIFIIYILIISRISDIKRIFMYHGAEHKAVHTYEAGEKLIVKNAKPFSTLHPRCGTSFLLIVMFLSIVIFSLVISDSWTIKFLSRLILLPVIAGTSYEVLKLAGKYQKLLLFKVISFPGMMLQKLTTAEPTDQQLEVALKSLSVVLEMEDE